MTQNADTALELKAEDVSKLMERLLKNLQFVELQPERLVDDGRTMRLIPARDGTPLRGEHTKWNSLPTLNLVAAGIETDRRTDTITNGVSQLLQGRRFQVVPNFNIPAILAILPELGEMIQLKALVWALRESHPFMEPNRQGIDESLDDLVKDLQAGFTLELQGSPIPGLDISKLVEGFIGNIAHFILPFEKFDQNSLEFKALKKAIDFYYVQMQYRGKERGYREYLDQNQQKWWFRLWNRKRKWEKAIDKWSAKLPQRLEEFETAVSALPA
jgi:hypothetical protein